MTEGASRELREAIEALAAGTAPDLVAEARREAEERARTILAQEITQAFLGEAEALLLARRRQESQPEASPGPPPRPAPGGPPEPPPPAADRSSEPPPPTEQPPPPPPAEQPREPTPLAAQQRELAHPEPALPTEPGPAATPEPALGLYLYGVVRADVRLGGELAGVDADRHVFLLEGNELAAVVSSVSMAEFDEEQLRENLNDVAWLEEKARAHEAVLEEMLASTTVVPTRLCTIFRDEKQVREMMGREAPALREALERLDGKSEWGAKAFAEPGALERAAAERAGETADGGTLSPGAAYMDRRRREAHAREEAEEVADSWAQQIHASLAGVAAEALLNPLQRREVSGHDGDMLLNGVYLVENEAVGRFRGLGEALGEEYRERGVSVELTGPWPAYNFVKSSIESAR